jgi:hypothetical protein
MGADAGLFTVLLLVCVMHCCCPALQVGVAGPRARATQEMSSVAMAALGGEGALQGMLIKTQGTASLSVLLWLSVGTECSPVMHVMWRTAQTAHSCRCCCRTLCSMSLSTGISSVTNIIKSYEVCIGVGGWGALFGREGCTGLVTAGRRHSRMPS